MILVRKFNQRNLFLATIERKFILKSIKICPKCHKRIQAIGCENWKEVHEDFIERKIKPFLAGVPGSEKIGDYSLEKKICSHCVKQGFV